jgi:hypothetical protein
MSLRAADVIEAVRAKGVKLWAVDGQLHYRAPKGVLLPTEVEQLRVARREIVALLVGHAPLSFPQLAYWHLYHLGTSGKARRHIASATRLEGMLNVPALKRSVAMVMGRHDALRTRFVMVNGTPLQEVAADTGCEIAVEDLSSLAEEQREAEVQHRIESLVLEPVDVAGPLIGVRLLKLTDRDHVLVVAIGHLIADEGSRGLLVREILSAYEQAVVGSDIPLRPVAIQYPEYARRQRASEEAWVKAHGRYWSQRLSDSRRVQFPNALASTSAAVEGWGVVSIKIGSEMKVALHNWCRAQRTTLALAVFTAYAASVLRWCDVSQIDIQYVSDGRTTSRLQNAVGFFATALFLRVGVSEGDSFVDLLHQVTRQFCDAHEHADSSYFAASDPQFELASSPAFNWVPLAADINLSGLRGSDYELACSTKSLANIGLTREDLDRDPGILLFETESEVVGSIHFPRSRFSAESMERFGRNFMAYISALLEQPHGKI